MRKKTKLPQRPLPRFVKPALAMLRDEAPTGREWVHETKFDGYRIQARLDHGKVRLLTRKGLNWTAKFPSVAKAVGKLRATTALIDGELVVNGRGGVSSFAALQSALKEGRRGGFIYHAFDLLRRNGVNVARLPLIERKTMLRQLIRSSRGGGRAIRYSAHRAGNGPQLRKRACRKHLEGIVSKRRDARYRSGRSDLWIKAKCSVSQELVVAGYADSTAMRNAVGALVVAYYRKGKLTYAGRIGTGYTRTTAKSLWKRLHAIERSSPSFKTRPRQEHGRRVHWVRPRTVIEADFHGWTSDGLVRQAAFKGIRTDKPAREVVRERAAPAVRRHIAAKGKHHAKKKAR